MMFCRMHMQQIVKLIVATAAESFPWVLPQDSEIYLAATSVDQNLLQPPCMLLKCQRLMLPVITDDEMLLYVLTFSPPGMNCLERVFWLLIVQLSLPESWHDHSVCLRSDSSGRAPRSCSFHSPLPRWPPIIITICLPP